MKIRTAKINEYFLVDFGYWTVMWTFVLLCAVTGIILT